ncbi:signal transduction histidine kinase [Glaciihabitans tibetensis]|uniref:histidine kinase n=1 Tax=Glaciihabitans tibetensis TaxID=1266600 RepID=A0A2T0VIP2_9MICO|nr:sensor domain-containing protein [Glaciihabitans tibetensis]PRY70091.1 signal transduction histidine kinase [Glaciihabitans tibetensis]
MSTERMSTEPMSTEPVTAEPMSTEPVSTEPVTAAPAAVSSDRPARFLRLYRRLWRTVPRELGFLVLSFPVALATFVVSIALVSTGVSSLILIFGVFIVVGALYVARAFGTFELIRLEWAGRPRIGRPEWQDGRAQQGFWGWLRGLFINGHYWLYLLHCLVLNFVVSLVTWTITTVALVYILAGLTGWAWAPGLPPEWQVNDNDWTLTNTVLGLFGQQRSGDALIASEHIADVIAGLILLVLLPFITRGLVLVHQGVARGLLGPFKSDALQREVIALNASRGAAVSAEGHSLRRLERDIHDGPQQRLVRLQMDLSAAQRHITKDPQQAQDLIAEAMLQAKEALEELRALSRGFAPPILLDRGLIAALESAAIRSSVPTLVFSELPGDANASGPILPQEIERNAYFVASEAILNAAKHSGASQIEVHVSVRRLPEEDVSWLDVAVSDNGRGGATFVPGHGLAGLEERLRGLGGILSVSSPTGGPTTVTAHLPLSVAMPGSVA